MTPLRSRLRRRRIQRTLADFLRRGPGDTDRALELALVDALTTGTGILALTRVGVEQFELRHIAAQDFVYVGYDPLPAPPASDPSLEWSGKEGDPWR